MVGDTEVIPKRHGDTDQPLGEVGSVLELSPTIDSRDENVVSVVERSRQKVSIVRIKTEEVTRWMLL